MSTTDRCLIERVNENGKTVHAVETPKQHDEDILYARDCELQQLYDEELGLYGVNIEDTRQESNGVKLEKPEPVHVEYDVSYSIEIEESCEKKMLLEKVSGAAEPGDLMAIMGPSGSGKTTLMTVLAGHKGSYSGMVSFNGKHWSDSNIQSTLKLCCFVQQEDLFIASMTPREHLLFSSRLRIDKSVSNEDKTRRAEGLLTELGLSKCADTPIGGIGSLVRGRISGGERKRLSLATELLSNPSVLFVEEPTTSIDSVMAETVVAKLSQLARAGHTVITTIHQPSSYIFSAFTKLHLLSNGKTAYSGTTAGAFDYFKSINRPVPPHMNPADYYLKLVSIQQVSDELIQNWKEKTVEKEDGEDKNRRGKLRRAPTVKLLISRKKYAASWCTQLTQLINRTVLSYRRDAALGRARLAQAVVLGVLIGLIYLMIGKSPIKASNVQSVNGVLFYAVLNQGLLGTLGVLQVFPLEKPVFLRESAANVYSPSAYFMGKTLAEFPFQVIYPFIFSTILYFLVGFGGNGAGSFFTFSLFIVLTAISAVSLGYFIGALSSSVGTALAVAPIVFVPLIIFGGLFINVDDIDPWFVWLSYLSFIRYGFEGVMIVIWEKEGDLGRNVLESFSWEVDHKWRNVGCLVALIIGFRSLAMIFLKMQTLGKNKLG